MGKRMTNVAQALDRAQVSYHNALVTSTSGTIASQTSRKQAGFVMTKTGGKTGRYTGQLDNKGASIRQVLATVETASADTAYTTTNAATGICRPMGTSGAFTVQMVDKAFADAEVEDAATIRITVITAE